MRAILYVVLMSAGVQTAAPLLVAAPVPVTLTSPRPGMLFCDDEPVDVRLVVRGVQGDARAAWSVHETDGPWEARGELVLPPAEHLSEVRLPLALPGRGLYRLDVRVEDGVETGEAGTSLAVVFTPPPPDPSSPWGIFYTPRTWLQPPYPGDDAAAAALSHRLLGASWSRLNFWAGSHGGITIETRDGRPFVTGDWVQWKRYARALRGEGISILGEIAQCPSELSSRQGDRTAEHGDAGEMQNRVKPRDYAEWDSFVENLAREFRDDIATWEIWNEANLAGHYWAGSVEELAELIEHTAASLRRGNPEARIMGCGFVGGHDYVERLLALGAGRHLDILSVHYTDGDPRSIQAWRDLLTRHDLHLPIWNSEERAEVPLTNLAGGIERTFKFMHIHLGYEAYRLLVNPDFTPRPPAIWFSVGAHCLRGTRFVRRYDVAPGCEAFAFERGLEQVHVFRSHPLSSILGSGGQRTLVVAVEVLSPEIPVVVTDRLGRSRTLAVRDGKVEIPLTSELAYVSGARALTVTHVQTGVGPGWVVEAEDCRHSPGWTTVERAGFSNGRTLDIWSDAEPGPEGYWVELPLTVPIPGRYEVLFAGNALTRLAPPRSLSPLAWRVDQGAEHVLDDATPMAVDIAGTPEGVSILGDVQLEAGTHIFRLRLTGRRDESDTHYALWFDALALRPLPAEPTPPGQP